MDAWAETGDEEEDGEGVRFAFNSECCADVKNGFWAGADVGVKEGVVVGMDVRGDVAVRGGVALRGGVGVSVGGDVGRGASVSVDEDVAAGLGVAVGKGAAATDASEALLTGRVTKEVDVGVTEGAGPFPRAGALPWRAMPAGGEGVCCNGPLPHALRVGAFRGGTTTLIRFCADFAAEDNADGGGGDFGGGGRGGCAGC